MAETIYVRGEGGAVIAMDLPLPEGIQERYDSGLIQRVHSDGSPWHTAAVPQTSAPVDPDGEQSETELPPAADAGRPGVNASKAEWIAYVVKSGRLSAEDAANYTKADLIDLMS